MTSYFDIYKKTPQPIKDFLLSDDYSAILVEYSKKFELGAAEVELDYLLQDIAVKAFEPAGAEEIKTEIQSRLGLDPEQATDLAYLIFTRFLPLVKAAWEKPNQETIAGPAQELQRLLTQIEAAKQSEVPRPGSPVLNLQKVVRPENLVTEPTQAVKIILPESESEQTPAPQSVTFKSKTETPAVNLGEGVKIPQEPKTLTLKDVKEINWSAPASKPSPSETVEIKADKETIPAKIIIKPEEKPQPSEPLDLSNF